MDRSRFSARWWGAAIACLGALLACEQQVVVDTTASATVLIGVVITDADSAFFTLGQVDPGPVSRPELGATMELTASLEGIRFQEGPRGACGSPEEFSCYRASLGGAVRAGSTIRLRGTLRDGRSIVGETHVPDAPDLRLGSDGELRPGDTLRAGPVGEVSLPILGLSEAMGRVVFADFAVDATVWSGQEKRICLVFPSVLRLGTDLRSVPSTRRVVNPSQPECPGEPLPWDSAAIPVTFLEYDQNFTRWADAFQLDFSKSSAFGVEGVEGVFGAAALARFVLIVTP